MGRKGNRRRNPAPSAGAAFTAEALGLDPAVWAVAIRYSKGNLSGSRYTSVSVCHVPSGRGREASFYAAGKAAARRDAAAAVKRLVKELGGG